MKLDKEQQRQMAQKVLQAYHIHPSVSQQFRKGTKNHRLYYSERANATFPAILYWLDNNPDWEAKAREIEAKTGDLIFHAVLTHTEFGDLLDFLAIPAESEALMQFAKEAEKGYFVSYCWNITDDHLETGYIKVRPRMGGIERVE